MNVIVRLEYKLAYYDSIVHRFNHNTTWTPLVCMRIYIYIYMCVCVCACICIDVWIYEYMCIFMFVYEYIYIYIYIYVSVYVYMNICVCRYIYIYIYMMQNPLSMLKNKALLSWKSIVFRGYYIPLFVQIFPEFEISTIKRKLFFFILNLYKNLYKIDILNLLKESQKTNTLIHIRTIVL